MKKVFFILIIALMTTIFLTYEVRALCCEDPGTHQCKCWSSGYCCYVDSNLPCASSCDGSCYWSPDPCAICNGNSICEYTRGEDQDNCPSDCYTTLEIYADLYPQDGNYEKVSASTPLLRGQPLILVLTFNDSRYNSTQGFNLKLDARIDGMSWNVDNGCETCDKRLDEMGCGAGMRGNKRTCEGVGYPIKIYMENGYARIEFNATLPKTLTSGTYTLIIKPVIMGSLLTLRAAKAQFTVGDGLYNFILIVKNVFNRLTGFFVYP
jgi:hypothetical protein